MRNKNCKQCNLHNSAESVCIEGKGPRADIMFIGGSPGFKEDEYGEPFIGRSGRILNAILDGLNIDRDDVFITYAVRCKSPENRKPTMKEMRACREYLFNEVVKVNPKIIVTLGNAALKTLFDSNKLSVNKERGKVLNFIHNGIKVIPTYDPMAAIKNQYYAKLIFGDLHKVLKSPNLGYNDAFKGFHRTYRLISPKNKSTALKRLTRASIISLDIESTGLDMYDSQQQLLMIGMSDKPHEADCWRITSGNLKVKACRD